MYSQHMFSCRNKKNIYLIPQPQPLLSGAVAVLTSLRQEHMVPLQSTSQVRCTCFRYMVYFVWVQIQVYIFSGLSPILPQATAHRGNLAFTTLWANSADNKLIIFYIFFSQKIGFDISLQTGDNVHEMSKPIFCKNMRIIFQIVIC